MTEKSALHLQLEIIQWKKKLLVSQAESLGYQHALLGVDEAAISQEITKSMGSAPSEATIAEGPMKGQTIGTFLKNDPDPE